MKPIFTYTNGMLPVSTHYCPGCTHGIAHRLIMEVLEENGKLGQAIGVAPIGCSVMAHQYMNVDMCEAAHGRAPAVATGIRRVHPDKVVFTYQGDGDLASIGMSEIIAAAARGERFSTFFINNGIYGMTGGQLAPTTLIGQRATTCQSGRTKEQGRHAHPDGGAAVHPGGLRLRRSGSASPTSPTSTKPSGPSRRPLRSR